MDKETRKANLRKLQLNGAGGSNRTERSRTLRSTQAVTMGISHYFDAPHISENTSNPHSSSNAESMIDCGVNKDANGIVIDAVSIEPNVNATAREGAETKQKQIEITKSPAFTPVKALQSPVERRSKRTKLSAFVHEPTARRSRAVLAADDFKTPEKKPVKCAPKFKVAGRKRPARQPNIKSAFLRNEELFAAVTAQHCMADNFSPEDVQMALAISMSEAEANSACGSAANDKVIVVDAGQSKGDTYSKNAAQHSVRSKLQQYGFRTAEVKDYDTIAATFLPTGKRRPKAHAKWTNKFTALTLRKAEEQQRKVLVKVKSILAQQCKTMPLDESPAQPYIPKSATLRQAIASSTVVAARANLDCVATVDLADYFVAELFEVSHVLAGYLLKDWAAVQGRDVSPQRQSTRDQLREEHLRSIYAELELHFKAANHTTPHSKTIETSVTEKDYDIEVNDLHELTGGHRKESCSANELDEIIQLIEANQDANVVKSVHVEETEIVDFVKQSNSPKLAAAPLTTQSKEPPIKRLCLAECKEAKTNQSSTWLQAAPISSNRATSPDLFADSDVEDGLSSMATWSSVASYDVESETHCTHTTCPADTVRCRINDGGQSSFKDVASIDLTLGGAKETNSNFINQQYVMPLEKSGVAAINENSFENLWCKRRPSENGVLLCESKSFSCTDRKLVSESARPQTKQDSLMQLTGAGSFHGLRRHKSASCTHRSVEAIVSASLLNLHQASVDLTQSDGSDNYETDEGDDECLILSDDEINYSIWKSNRTINTHRNTSIGMKGELVTSESDMEQLVPGLDVAKAAVVNVSESLMQNLTDEHIQLVTPSKRRKKHQSTPDRNFSMIQLSKEPIPVVFPSKRRSQQSGPSRCSLTTASAFPDHDEFTMIDEPTPTVHFSKRRSRQSTPGRCSMIAAAASLDPADLSMIELSDESIPFDSPLRTRPLLRSFDCDDKPFAEQAVDHPQISPKRSNCSRVDLCKERAEFGILDAGHSEPLTLCESPPAGDADASMLGSPCDTAALMKRFSSTSSRKFDSLLHTVRNAATFATADDSDIEYADFDEFDKLIYGSPVRQMNVSKRAEPAGLEQLLTGEITVCAERAGTPPMPMVGPSSKITRRGTLLTSRDLSASELQLSQAGPMRPVTVQRLSNEHEMRGTSSGQSFATSEDAAVEHVVNGRIYCVRTVNTPKPKFVQMSEAEVLQQLYSYGIKPLKRKQAIQILEYIYTQTHPVLVEDVVVDKADYNFGHETPSKMNAIRNPHKDEVSVARNTDATDDTYKLMLEDGCDSGDALLRYAGELSPVALAPSEDYILQTNISKKVAQPLLPFQIAWYNLLSSCTILHERILSYDPIDLQQIYLHFKRLGHRYDPKDLKAFFDRRCIIFRYDLNPTAVQQTRPTAPAKRHLRKKTKAATKRYASANCL